MASKTGSRSPGQIREEIGRICRAVYQKLGVSNPNERWSEVTEERRELHRTAGDRIVAELLDRKFLFADPPSTGIVVDPDQRARERDAARAVVATMTEWNRKREERVSLLLLTHIIDAIGPDHVQVLERLAQEDAGSPADGTSTAIGNAAPEVLAATSRPSGRR